jgi:hypothetical protein
MREWDLEQSSSILTGCAAQDFVIIYQEYDPTTNDEAKSSFSILILAASSLQNEGQIGAYRDPGSMRAWMITHSDVWQLEGRHNRPIRPLH